MTNAIEIQDLRKTYRLRGGTTTAADGDQAAMRALDENSVDPFDNLNRRAHEYSLTVCGEEGD